jgi:hypothetical protein
MRAESMEGACGELRIGVRFLVFGIGERLVLAYRQAQ